MQLLATFEAEEVTLALLEKLAGDSIVAHGDEGGTAANAAATVADGSGDDDLCSLLGELGVDSPADQQRLITALQLRSTHGDGGGGGGGGDSTSSE